MHGQKNIKLLDIWLVTVSIWYVLR